MASTRLTTLGALKRFGGLTVDLLFKLEFEPRGLTIKAAERVLRFLRLDGLVRSHPYRGRKLIYCLTPKGARLLNCDERKFRRAPSPQVIEEQITIAAFCARYGHRLYTPAEYREAFPQLVTEHLSDRRYFLNQKLDPPQLTLIVPDFVRRPLSYRRIVSKCRKEVSRRKGASLAWRDAIFVYPLFGLAVLTAFDSKAERIRKALRHDTYPHEVFALPEILELLYLKEGTK